MSNQPLFTLLASSDLPTEDREALLNEIKDVVDVNRPSQHQFAAGWELFIAFAKDAGIVVGAATAFVKLANEINTWRKNVREAGREPKVKLQSPNKPALDLNSATDEEVKEWLTAEERDS